MKVDPWRLLLEALPADTRAWAIAHRDQVLPLIRSTIAAVQQQRPQTGAGLWERFHATVPPKGPPRPDDLPHGLVGAADQIIATCERYMDEPEGFWAWNALTGADAGEAADVGYLPDSEEEVLAFFLAEAGLDDTAADRDIARFAWRIAMESDPERYTGEAFGDPVVRDHRRRTPAKGGHHHVYRDSARNGPLPRWMARAVLADRLAEYHLGHTPSLRLAVVDRVTATAFIRRHHSELPTFPARTMYALGAYRGDRLVAVATAGHPNAPFRRVDQRNVLELTRIASDGTTAGAASMLAARLLDVAPRSKRGDPGGPWLFVTYSLTSEEGATYRALADKGLRPVEVIQGKRGAQGSRSAPPLGDRPKVRWEAGPAALPAISL